ncbi:hypothetical protein ACJMK2_044277 [Sinanodonta woodiana]|uniref:Uncharacterized protein n=1 Tax=Sinanodonta woodiana TaxID=1069815 RepID=A0ABD3W355_SINWO
MRGFGADLGDVSHLPVNLSNMDLWKKYLDKMAKASLTFFEETMEIVQDMEKVIGELQIDTSENGVHLKMALEFNVKAFRARAEAAQVVAEIDREAVKSLNSFVEDKKVVKEIKDTEKEFKEAKKSFSKVADKLDSKYKKVTRTYRRLQKLRVTNVASENEIISDRYEIQAKQVTRDKINCLASTWKKMFENHARLSFNER